jgi:hypothetical protein
VPNKRKVRDCHRLMRRKLTFGETSGSIAAQVLKIRSISGRK